MISDDRDSTGSSAPAGAAAEIELLQRMAHGDKAALGALYDRFAPSLIALAQRILVGSRDAEEVVHESMLEVWHRARYYDASCGSVASWLALRVRARSLQRLRGRSAGAAPARVQDPPSDAAACSGLLDHLPAEQRAVVELAYFGGYSCAEISLRLAVPVGTVRSRLAAAIQLLQRRQLEQSEDGQP